MSIEYLDISGIFASWVGLLVSAWTLIVAKGAKRAAEAASANIWRISAAADFQEMAQRAKELLNHVQGRRGALATVRASDLLHLLQSGKARWFHLLDQESRENLTFSQEKLATISKSLSIDQIPENPRLFRELSNGCNDLLIRLSTEAGRIQMNAESKNE
jgi:hypothetical protein